MSRTSIQVSLAAVAILSAAALLPGDTAGQMKEPQEKAADDEADRQYRRQAEKLVSGISLQMLQGDKWNDVKRIEKALLYYGDDTRQHDRGSVWGWGDRGRPVAVIELYQNIRDRQKWVFAICNTSGGKLRADRDGMPWWRENTSATGLQDIPGAPAPFADGPQRQRQLKQLAQKFTGHEFWDPNNSRYELRRLDRPLHSYKDEAAGLLDGALYILANGTNPEILLFLEARRGPAETAKPAWHFAVGRLAHAELHLDYDRKEVFTAPRGNRLAARDQPYWVEFINTPTEPKPEK
jgi:hypothetical protein